MWLLHSDLLLLQQRSPGKGLFDLVCAHLNLTEADYFGLEYQDHRKMMVRRRRETQAALGFSMMEASADVPCNARVCLRLRLQLQLQLLLRNPVRSGWLLKVKTDARFVASQQRVQTQNVGMNEAGSI